MPNEHSRNTRTDRRELLLDITAPEDMRLRIEVGVTAIVCVMRQVRFPLSGYQNLGHSQRWPLFFKLGDFAIEFVPSCMGGFEPRKSYGPSGTLGWLVIDLLCQYLKRFEHIGWRCVSSDFDRRGRDV